MSDLKLGIAGLGTVGVDVIRLLDDHAALLRKRTGRNVIVTAVSARSKSKDRGVDLSGYTWHDNPQAMVSDDNVDVIVELMGGAEGDALALVTAALAAGKPVVTANKALLAVNGHDVFAKAQNGLGYEAAVAGGIPIIKGLREGLSANDVKGVYGILNGTCNYILSEMSKTGRAFEDVLKEAQELGYAEADPTFDVDGIDAAHKTALLAALAFGGLPNFGAVDIKGIRAITPLDIKFAEELGYRIKLLGIARKTEQGIEQSVEPCLVPKTSPVASIEGALNAVYVDGDYVGKTLFVGAGAGGRATASAVVADIVDVARGQKLPPLGLTDDQTEDLPLADIHHRHGYYYLRLVVLDKPGVIADVSAILRDENVSLESVLQHGRAPDAPVPVILTTHETEEAAIRKVAERIAALEAVTEPPYLMRIEEFE